MIHPVKSSLFYGPPPVTGEKIFGPPPLQLTFSLITIIKHLILLVLFLHLSAGNGLVLTPKEINLVDYSSFSNLYFKNWPTPLFVQKCVGPPPRIVLTIVTHPLINKEWSGSNAEQSHAKCLAKLSPIERGCAWMGDHLRVLCSFFFLFASKQIDSNTIIQKSSFLLSRVAY